MRIPTTHIALLRAVNLGSHNRVAMADLRALLADLGMVEPRSLLQSGNLVFRSGLGSTAELERLLEEAAAERLGLETDLFVRTVAEWRRIVEVNPFPDEAKRDPSHLLVMALKTEPSARAVPQVQAAIKGREAVRVVGRQAYIVYPDGIGRSRLRSAVLERHLGTRGTARNWNTVLKLAALAATPD